MRSQPAGSSVWHRSEKKLRRSTIQLVQIQDLAGCRAIAENTDSLRRLIEFYREGLSRHKVREDRSYIERPKQNGYRSHHFVLDYNAEDDHRHFDGKRIEVQVRTRLQHAWATAVEAVGLFLNQDLKAGEGNQDWLRLFALVSSEFAEVENCSPIPGCENRRDRIRELIDLNARLRAAQTMQDINQAVKASEGISRSNSGYFLIQVSADHTNVKVKSFSKPSLGTFDYGEEELKAEQFQSSVNTVLVEVDKADKLRDAYPNYFLDISTFATAVSELAANRRMTAHAPTQATNKRIRDLSFLQQMRDKYMAGRSS